MSEKLALIQKLAANLVNRCNRELPETLDAVDDLKLFVRLHSDDLKSDPIVETLEKILATYIVNHGSQLAEEYFLLTGINKFEHYSTAKYLDQPALPPISAEDMILIQTQVEKNCAWNLLKKTRGLPDEERALTKYKIGQIVGARDCERRWWMARILFVFEDPSYPYPWYYVHFEGWGDIHNEWISSPERVKQFNAKRDFLKR